MVAGGNTYMAGLAILTMPARSIVYGSVPLLVCRSLKVQHVSWRAASPWPWRPMDKPNRPLHSFHTFAAACAATASSSSAAAFAFRAAISGGKIGPAGCAGGLKAVAGSSQGILHHPHQAGLLRCRVVLSCEVPGGQAMLNPPSFLFCL